MSECEACLVVELLIKPCFLVPALAGEGYTTEVERFKARGPDSRPLLLSWYCFRSMTAATACSRITASCSSLKLFLAFFFDEERENRLLPEPGCDLGVVVISLGTKHAMVFPIGTGDLSGKTTESDSGWLPDESIA